MQLSYLDESGVGDPIREPHTVVSGVIVDADKQLIDIQKHLLGMVEKYVPSEHRKGFRFHAVELFNGGKIFKRAENPEIRLRILEELCEIPNTFNLPIVAAYCDRMSVAKESPNLKITHQTAVALGSAGFICMLQIEHYMRNRPDEREVSAVHFEDNHLSRELIKQMVRNLSDADYTSKMPAQLPQMLPIRRIMSEISFQIKGDSSLLQLADACAFVIRKKLSGDNQADRFFSRLNSQLLSSATDSLALA